MTEPQPNDLEARMTILERDMAQLREDFTDVRADATAARGLAAAADRDVSEVRAELRAHTSVLNALRKTQLEYHEELLKHRGEFRDFKVETRSGFATLHTGMAHITSLLEGLAGENDASGAAAE